MIDNTLKPQPIIRVYYCISAIYAISTSKK